MITLLFVLLEADLGLTRVLVRPQALLSIPSGILAHLQCMIFKGTEKICASS